MDQQPGYKTLVAVSTNGTSYTNLAVKSADLEELCDLADVTNFDTASTDYKAALSVSRRKAAQLHDTTISIEGDYDGSTEQATTLASGANVYILIGIDTSGNGTIDDVVANVPMIVGTRSRTFNVEETNSFSVDLQGNGPVKATATY